MLDKIILYLGVVITLLIFVLVTLDLTLLGTRNIIRISFTDIRVFMLLIGIPYIILFLLLLVFQVLPNFLFPIQLVLLIAYGIGKKKITTQIHSSVNIQSLDQSRIAFLLKSIPSRGCFGLSKDAIRFINLLAILAFAFCGALWVLANEENQWFIYPVVGVLFIIFFFTKLFEIGELVRLITKKSSRQDDE